MRSRAVFLHRPAPICPKPPKAMAIIEGFGEVDERFKSHAWKACVG